LLFSTYGSEYTFYTLQVDTTFTFDNLPTGRSIEFTLDITVDSQNTSPITILFPQVTNPPVLAGEPGDRNVLRFIGVNKTDPTGVDPPVQTFTFLTGATTVIAGYSTIEDEGVSVLQRSTMNFIGSGVTAVDNPTESRTDITITGGGGGNVPDGTAAFQHLEWDGTAWIAQQALSFGASSGTQAQLNFPNNITGLAWKNQVGLATGDLTLTVDNNDKFLFGIGDGNDVLEIDVKTLDNSSTTKFSK